MMTTIAPEPKGSSRSKEYILFGLIGFFVLFSLMLPSFAFMYLTRKNPEVGDFVKYVTEQTKSDIKNEINAEPQNKTKQMLTTQTIIKTKQQ